MGPGASHSALRIADFIREDFDPMTDITRRSFLMATTAAGAFAVIGTKAFAELPKLAQKDKYKVGFAQTESMPPAPPPSRSPTSIP